MLWVIQMLACLPVVPAGVQCALPRMRSCEQSVIIASSEPPEKTKCVYRSQLHSDAPNPDHGPYLVHGRESAKALYVFLGER